MLMEDWLEGLMFFHSVDPKKGELANDCKILIDIT